MTRLGLLFMEAARHLWGTRLYALLMMAGLIIGTSSVTVIYEIGQGVRQQVMGMMASMGFGADALFITSGSHRVSFRRATRTLTLQDVEELRRLDNVAALTPHLSLSRERLSLGGRHTSASITGTTSEFAVSSNWEVARGRFLSPEDQQHRRLVVVLGHNTAAELFAEENPLGRQLRVGKVLMEVIGVLQAKGGGGGGGHRRDDLVLTPLSTAMRRLSKEDKISGLRVNLADPGESARTVTEISELLRARHRLAPGMPDDFQILTPDYLVGMITKQSQTMVRLLTFISVVSLFVAGLVIMNIMLVTVSERTQEIGVRRALGARRRDILLQIFFETLLVAFVGGACGMLLGQALSWLVRLTLAVPTAFSAWGMLLSLLFSAAVGLLFGLIPARKAAALSPVESFS